MWLGLLGGSVGGNYLGRKGGSAAYSFIAGDDDTEKNIGLVLNAMKCLEILYKDPERITEQDVREHSESQF